LPIFYERSGLVFIFGGVTTGSDLGYWYLIIGDFRCR